MSSGEPDPPRLLDEGGSEGELRALMRAGKSEVPNEAQMLALAAKLGALGGLGGAGAAGAAGAGGAGAAATGAGMKAALALKMLAAFAVIGVVGGGVAIVRRNSGEAATPVGIIAVRTSPSASASPTAGASPSGAGASPSAGASPTASTRLSAGTSLSASASPSATTAPTAGARPAESPDAEVKLLARAQDALRRRPAEALALCNDHATRFPAGALVQEREVIAIDALVQTGRHAEARARADGFEARFPGSTHTRRIESLLAN